MKNILLSLFTLYFSIQFSQAQEQNRLSAIPLDSNITCDKATQLNINQFFDDSFSNKVKLPDFVQPAYFSFIAVSKTMIIQERLYDPWITLYDQGCNKSISKQYNYSNSKCFISDLTIGNVYKIKLFDYLYSRKNFQIGVFISKEDDFTIYPTYINENINYNFNLFEYSKGRDINSICTTTKADSNTVDLFVKFKATSTAATLDLNLDNAALESRLGLISAPNTCQPIQKNKNLRTDTFTGLTIGNDYTVRIEIGGDAVLGYIRIETANNASITLVGGTVTSVENNSQPIFSIAPNPSNGKFTFVSNESADLVIYDLLGSEIAYLHNVSPNQNIDLQLSKGIYLIKVSNDKGSEIEKLVIE